MTTELTKTEQKPADHKAIREALEAGPTEGPWVHNKQGYPKSDVRAAGDGGRNIANTWGTAASQAKTPEAYKARTDQDRLNAAYIAACNPSAIRSLLADLDEARSALTAAKAGGWVAVPVEPTEEMLDAAFAYETQAGGIQGGDVVDAYKAMLAARPLPTPPKDPA